jgi:hypothetical protein
VDRSRKTRCNSSKVTIYKPWKFENRFFVLYKFHLKHKRIFLASSFFSSRGNFVSKLQQFPFCQNSDSANVVKLGYLGTY